MEMFGYSISRSEDRRMCFSIIFVEEIGILDY